MTALLSAVPYCACAHSAAHMSALRPAYLTHSHLLSTGSESDEAGLLESSEEDPEAADVEAVDPDDLSEDVGF